MADNETKNKVSVTILGCLLASLFTINITLLTGLRSDFKDMDTKFSMQLADVQEKIFHHLTNSDLHVPRSIMDSQVNELRKSMTENRILIETKMGALQKDIKDALGIK